MHRSACVQLQRTHGPPLPFPLIVSHPARLTLPFMPWLCTQVRLKTDGEEGCYFENRLGCGASNPYLVLAGTVAAGLDGLKNQLEPPTPDTTEGCTELPKTLPEALDALEADEYMVGALGAEFVKWFRILKEAEVEAVSVPAGCDDDSERLGREKSAYLRFL